MCNLCSSSYFTWKTFCLIWTLIFAGSCAYAKQTEFKQSNQGTSSEFSYQWQDQFQQPISMTFQLSNNAISQGSNRPSYRPEMETRYVFNALQREAASISPKEAKVKVSWRGQDFNIEVTGQSQAMISKWQELMQQKQQEAILSFLSSSNLSSYTDHLGKTIITPDYLNQAKKAKASLYPAKDALRNLTNDEEDKRILANMLLSWLQSISDQAMADRLTSQGGDFSAPVDVIFQNKGNPDSKATLGLALFQALFPDAPLVLIILPRHALLGIGMPHRESERTLRLQGEEYLLMEVASANKMLVSQAAPSSWQAINAGWSHTLVVR